MRTRLALARQLGQRWGTFTSPFSAKNRCSPPEKMKSSAQSRQVSVRSSYTASVLRSRGSHVRSASPTRPVLLQTGLDPEPAGENTVAVKGCHIWFERCRHRRCPTAPLKDFLRRSETDPRASLGLYVQKDGQLYSLALRPLLPDKAS
jgi:hypothetical protein